MVEHTVFRLILTKDILLSRLTVDPHLSFSPRFPQSHLQLCNRKQKTCNLPFLSVAAPGITSIFSPNLPSPNSSHSLSL